MAATVTTILAKVRKNVVDVPADTEDGLVGWINEAQQVAEDDYNWKGLESYWIPSTAVGTNNLAVPAFPTVRKPADWLVAIGDPYWRSGDNGVHHQMVWGSSFLQLRKDYPQSNDVGYRGRPALLYENINSISVYPASDGDNTIGSFSADGEYDVIIPYRRSEPVLTATTPQTNFFTEDVNLALHLTDYCSGQALLFNSDFDKANTYLLKAQGHLLRAKRLDKRGKAQSIKFTPRRDVYASRRQPRAV